MAWQLLAKAVAKEVLKKKVKEAVVDEFMEGTEETDANIDARKKLGQISNKAGNLKKLLKISNDIKAVGDPDAESQGLKDDSSLLKDEDRFADLVKKMSEKDKPSLGKRIASGVGNAALEIVSGKIESKTGYDLMESIEKKRDASAAEEMKHKMVAQAMKDGMTPEAAELLMSFKAKDSKSMAAGLDSLGDWMDERTQAGVEKKIKDAVAKQKATELAKYSPEITEKKMDLKRQEEKLEYEYNRKEAFAKIQEDLIKKGTDLTVDEKSRLVSAQTGQRSINMAYDLLESEDFNRLVIQQGLSGGKLSTYGQTNLRKYNTAVGSAIFDYVFAKSGAQVSDKERKAFADIFDIKLGDTKEVAEFKLDRLNDFFVTAEDIFDPNGIAGLTVSELNQKYIEIRKQFADIKGGDSLAAEYIIDSLKERASGKTASGEGSVFNYSEDKEARYQAWKKKQGFK